MEVKKKKKPEIRHLNEIKGVLYDKNWAESAPNLELYYIYRGVKEKNDLRYDITVIPGRMLGKEFVKTKGNRNSDNFPEFYTVLEGKLLFLMQKSNRGIIKDVALVELKKGDWIVIPSDYYGVAINPIKKVLKTANWVSKKNENTYSEMEKMGGACYYYTKSGWVKNKNYKRIPKLRFQKPLKKRPVNLDFPYGKN